jgi:ssDNA-binding replication factor A large subunit
MIKVPYESILLMIQEKSTLSREQIEAKIKEKLDLLSGLVSKEGAAHIIANELGISLVAKTSGKMQVSKLLNGMRDVSILAKVVQVYEAKTFEKSGKSGSVGSFIAGDESGTIRVVLWNEQTKRLSELKKGDVVRIEAAYVRPRQDGVELHLGDRSVLTVNPQGEVVNFSVPSQSGEKKKLNEITANDNTVEVTGTVVQVFDPRFYEVCPTCGKRARMDGSRWVCDNHGVITPAYAYVINAFIDDSTEQMRIVCFKEQARELLRKSDTEIMAFKDSPELFETARTEMLAAFLSILGRVRKNEMFDRLEITAQKISPANPEAEVARFE